MYFLTGHGYRVFFVKFLTHPFVCNMVLKFQDICTAKGILILGRISNEFENLKACTKLGSELKILDYERTPSGYTEVYSTLLNSGLTNPKAQAFFYFY
jgi:hypothetical protein